MLFRSYGVVAGELDLDATGMAGDGLVHSIVEDLGGKVMKGPLVGAADIHAGAPAHRLEAFEDLDVLGGIAGGGLAGEIVEEIGHGAYYRNRGKSKASSIRYLEAIPAPTCGCISMNDRAKKTTSDPPQEGPPGLGEPALRAIAMPGDANPNGDIFGGWLLAQMDLAGGSVASQRAQGRVATVAVTGMSFELPVFTGDEVSCYAEIVKIGRSSLTVRIESWVRRHLSDERVRVTEGTFTYVPIDGSRRPRRVPSEEPTIPV